MKKTVAIILSTLLLLTATAFAAINVRGEYEGFGYMEIDLSRDVRWNNPEVLVTDANGAAYAAELVKLDDDDIKFQVAGIVEDQVYNVSLSGIQGEETVSCEIYAASLKSNMIKDVDYDAEDRELDIDFSARISYDGEPAVSVSDAAGNTYECRITERDKDSIEVRVNGLNLGDTYTVSVSGVISPESGAAETWSREFVAWDN